MADAIQVFMQYNPDPKASIVATYLKLPTPDLTFNLDEAILMFLIYDGPNAGDVFNNFTSISYLLSTMSLKTYPEVINMPIPSSPSSLEVITYSALVFTELLTMIAMEKQSVRGAIGPRQIKALMNFSR